MSFDTDRIVSVSAMVVGVASLFTIVYQTQLTRLIHENLPFLKRVKVE